MASERVHTTGSGCLSEASVVMWGTIAFAVAFGTLAVISVNADKNQRRQSPTPLIIPTPTCLMDGRPTPSERTYSAKSPDGSSVSVLSSATIFDTKTCPPSSR